MSNNTNSCIANSCYGVYRTSFDRMMQNKHSPFCKPSSQLVCDQAGNPVLKTPQARGVLAEKYRARRAHVMRARALQARRRRAAVERFQAPRAQRRRRVERFKPAPPPPNGKPAGKGNGKKKAVVLTKAWCGYCKKIQEEMEDIIRMLGEMGIEVEVAPDHAVDPLMDEHREKGANGFPATLLMDENGEVQDVLSGYRPAEKFAAAVKEKYGM